MKDSEKKLVSAVMLKVVTLPWHTAISKTGLLGSLLNDRYLFVLPPGGSSPLPVGCLASNLN